MLFHYAEWRLFRRVRELESEEFKAFHFFFFIRQSLN